MSYAQKLRLLQRKRERAISSIPPLSVHSILCFSSSQLFLHPRRLRLLLIQNHLAFVSTIYFLFALRENLSLRPFLRLSLSVSLSTLFLPSSICCYDPAVRCAEGNPRNLLEISWIIINAYVVAGDINGSVVPLFVLLCPLLVCSSFSFAAIGGFRYVLFVKTA